VRYIYILYIIKFNSSIRKNETIWIESKWNCHPADPPGLLLLACQEAAFPLAHWSARLPPCRPAWLLLRRPARLLPTHQHTGCHLPQKGSNTTRHRLQTCLGDTDKQDWMLKE
jgi:hypothetical protein